MHGQCFMEVIGHQADLKEAGLPIRVVIASPRLDAIHSIVKRAGLDFLAPATRNHRDHAIASIHPRTEKVTPQLDEFLRHFPGAWRNQPTQAP